MNNMKKNNFWKGLPKIGLFKNFGIKIGALLFAIIVWILVTNINDPLTNWTIGNVQVRLLHTNIITDNGQVYTVLDDTDVIPVVTVRANRSINDALKDENIIATADFEDMTSQGTIEIKYYSTRYDNEIESITGSIVNVKLSIEDRKTASFALKTTTTGDPAQGYQIGTVTPEQNQIRISGPESIVSRISSAVASVDVSGATGSISTYSDIKLYDADDVQITDTGNLTMNITSVKVNVNVLPITDVPITAQYTGHPADGYILNGTLSVEPSAVELAGKSSILSTVQNIVIPQTELDITGSTGDFVKTIDITNYLPEGVTFADSTFDGNVTVTIGIDREATTSVTAGISDISLSNIPEGYSADIMYVTDGVRTITATSGTQFELVFSGLSADVNGITLRRVSPSINVGDAIAAARGSLEGTDLSGTYYVTVDVLVPDNVTLESSISASVRVTNMNVQTETVESTEETTSTTDEAVGDAEM